MTDESMNLFWKQKDKPGIDYSEKENNVTHAFLATVRNEPKFLAAVLQKAGIKTNLKPGYEVYFQVDKKRRYQTLDAENRFILFISSKYKRAEFESDGEKGTIPDGLIIDGKTSIIIESKVTSSKDHGQLKRYNDKFYKGAGEVWEIYWENIYSLARRYVQSGRSSIGDYLLDQFHEYLEVVNMAGFDGIPFFKKDESYEKKIADKVLKRLGVDMEHQEWFKRHNFVLAGRPKTGTAWDYFYNKDIKETKPLKFPHYSIYIFDDFFGVDMLFHKQELRKILNDEQLRETFFGEVEKLAKTCQDYFLHVVDYRLLANKRKGTGARVGPKYSSLEFMLQLSRFIQQNRKDWKEKLTQHLELLAQQSFKQISVMKKAFYGDKEYKELDSGGASLKFIKDTVNETKHLYDMMLNLHYKKGGK